MRWLRLGKIFTTQGKFNWATNYALQPTPLVMKDRVRVYVGLRDDEGVGRVGWVDLALNNPDQVIGFSEKPALDIGQPGAFDEFGVIPSAVIEHEGRIFLFYAGYQRGIKVRFLVFGGLAVSYDGGDTFSRVKKTPIFERTDNEVLFRVPHSVLKDEGKFRFWYGGGSRFEVGKEKTLPIYDVRYLESDTLATVPSDGQVCLRTQEGEYRVGRPYVIRRDGFKMFYGYSTEDCHYQLGMASSKNGLDWVREDDRLGLPLSDTGWDSTMMAYPAVFETDAGVFIIYNGNDYGYEGFGMAKLLEW